MSEIVHCADCIYGKNCPCNWSYCCSACLIISKKRVTNTINTEDYDYLMEQLRTYKSTENLEVRLENDDAQT